MTRSTMIRIDETDLRIEGRLLRTARLNDEYYVSLPSPERLERELRTAGIGADLLTFVQELDDTEVHHGYRLSWDEMAVLRLSTYEHWFNKQLHYKTRNMVRKAWKKEVETTVVPFDDQLVAGIREIYDETPLRQGKRNLHYGKDLETLRREHATFLGRSEFIGAFCAQELIGFAKITHGPRYSIIMNIIAKVGHRDKAPMNALVAKAVECVCARGIPLLNYGIWGNRKGLNEFKASNDFECLRVPRYHVPLSLRGGLALRLGLHRGLKERLPETWITKLADARTFWNERRHTARSVQGRGAGPMQQGKS